MLKLRELQLVKRILMSDSTPAESLIAITFLPTGRVSDGCSSKERPHLSTL